MFLHAGRVRALFKCWRSFCWWHFPLHVPPLFYQLLTVSVVLEGVSVNVAYFLLSGKSRKYMWPLLESSMKPQGPTVNLRSRKIVQSDYELALIQALLYGFPETRPRGCHFHFALAMWRKVQSLWLSKAYQENALVKIFVWLTISLAFVPLPLQKWTLRSY